MTNGLIAGVITVVIFITVSYLILFRITPLSIPVNKINKEGIKMNYCYICKTKMEYERFTLYSIEFPELETHPVVCSVCMFEKLTGDKIEWTEEIKKSIKEDKICQNQTQGF